MSEEEKDLCELLKGVEVEKHAIEDIDLFIHCLNYGEMKITIASERQKEIAQELHILLNLLTKQQKEIEELKEKNDQLTNYLNDSFYVSADKIREKIKELELFKKALPIRGTEIDRFIGELKELLEEE